MLETTFFFSIASFVLGWIAKGFQVSKEKRTFVFLSFGWVAMAITFALVIF